MKRDELIEELKKCPVDAEVEIVVVIKYDCPQCGYIQKPWRSRQK